MVEDVRTARNIRDVKHILMMSMAACQNCGSNGGESITDWFDTNGKFVHRLDPATLDYTNEDNIRGVYFTNESIDETRAIARAHFEHCPVYSFFEGKSYSLIQVPGNPGQLRLECPFYKLRGVNHREVALMKFPALYVQYLQDLKIVRNSKDSRPQEK